MHIHIYVIILRPYVRREVSAYRLRNNCVCRAIGVLYIMRLLLFTVSAGICVSACVMQSTHDNVSACALQSPHVNISATIFKSEQLSPGMCLLNCN